ncbi:MAG: hypothetical protein WAV32_06060 [Halobacteriota archaeon]
MVRADRNTCGRSDILGAKNVSYVLPAKRIAVIMAHVFITFLSLYIRCKQELLLKNAKRNHKVTPMDLLRKYSKVYHFELAGHGINSEVLKKMMDLDATFELSMFPKTGRS